jgi:hypothetical protein
MRVRVASPNPAPRASSSFSSKPLPRPSGLFPHVPLAEAEKILEKVAVPELP